MTYCNKNEKWQISWQFVQYGGLNPVSIYHFTEVIYTLRLQSATTYETTLMWLLKRNAYHSKLSISTFAKTWEKTTSNRVRNNKKNWSARIYLSVFKSCTNYKTIALIQHLLVPLMSLEVIQVKLLQHWTIIPFLLSIWIQLRMNIYSYMET